MVLSRWLVIALGTQVARGGDLPVNERCVTAVYSAYNYVSFAGSPAKGLWDTRCRNPLKVASIYAASEVYCQDQERATGLAQLAAFCEEIGHRELLPREAVAENLTEDVIRNMRTVGYLEIPRAEMIDTPVLLSASFFNRMFNTIVCPRAVPSLPAWNDRKLTIAIFPLHRIRGSMRLGRIMHLATSDMYIGVLFWLVGLFTGYAAICFMSAMFEESPIWNLKCTTDLVFGMAFRGWNIYFTHFIVPAPFATKGRNLIGLIFSNRAESLVVAGFWLISIILSLLARNSKPTLTLFS
ncbi:hypothetical protein N7476_001789 [Penicillium atrosanguineum]|uniref:Uncharacterized protein n=1 Tax=Penicillium atrosanguineum TaxID=1132637 RepID=A0A9W9QE35_9EURO|nr:hypothetical protein N7476_001789 [Penicillium atrosanguineum]